MMRNGSLHSALQGGVGDGLDVRLGKCVDDPVLASCARIVGGAWQRW